MRGLGGGFGVAAVEDVVELGDRVAAFDADWHGCRCGHLTWWRGRFRAESFVRRDG